MDTSRAAIKNPVPGWTGTLPAGLPVIHDLPFMSWPPAQNSRDFLTKWIYGNIYIVIRRRSRFSP